MQSGSGDDDAADIDRRQIGPRRQHAGAADRDLDRFQVRLSLLRGEFMGKGPARRPADHAEPRLPVEAVDFVDDAVDVVGERRAVLAEIVMEGEGILERLA